MRWLTIVFIVSAATGSAAFAQAPVADPSVAQIEVTPRAPDSAPPDAAETTTPGALEPEATSQTPGRLATPGAQARATEAETPSSPSTSPESTPPEPQAPAAPSEAAPRTPDAPDTASAEAQEPPASPPEAASTAPSEPAPPSISAAPSSPPVAEAPHTKIYPSDSSAARPLTVADGQLDPGIVIGGLLRSPVDDGPWFTLLGTMFVRYGLSDTLELRLPLAFARSFGDPEGITETDRALEFGLSGLGFGVSSVEGFVLVLDVFAGFSMRKRVLSSSALVGGLELHALTRQLDLTAVYAVGDFGLVIDLSERFSLDLSMTVTGITDRVGREFRLTPPKIRFADLTRPLVHFHASRVLDIVATAGIGYGGSQFEVHGGAGVWVHIR